MKYEFLENGVIASFNRLITSISKRGDKVLIRQLADHTDKLELLLDYFKKKESSNDMLMLESGLDKERLSKLASIFEMMISGIDPDSISTRDLNDLNVMRLGRLYSAKSFLEANDSLNEKKHLKRLGFKFKNKLSLEQLNKRITECNNELIRKHENITKR
jgi:hypothetical protein